MKINMTHKVLLTGAGVAALALAACDPKPQPVGGDRDAHGCLPSGGYEWSPLLQDCIRIWEAGVQLTDVRNPDATGAAYVLGPGERGMIEVHLPSGADVIVLSADPDGGAKSVDGYVLDETMTLFGPDGTRLFARADILIPDAEEMEPKLGVFTAPATIVSVEDGIYPMFVVTAELEDSFQTLILDLNAEGTNLDMSTFYGASGMAFDITYESVLRPDIRDVAIDGVSIWSGSETRSDTGTHRITGTLEGAYEISMGDLPDEVSVTSEGGVQKVFETYIDETLLAYEGAVVTVIFDERLIHNLISAAPR